MPNSPPLTQLAHLPALSEALRALAHRGEVRRYRKNTLLIEEGDHGDTLYLILAGRLRSYAIGDKGREITYGVYGPGEYLGEMSLDGGPRSANVITLEASSCVVITRTTLERHIAEYPQFAFELIAKVIRRARAATLSAKQLALNDVYGRLVLLLNSLAVAQARRHAAGRRAADAAGDGQPAGLLARDGQPADEGPGAGGYVRRKDGHWVLRRPLAGALVSAVFSAPAGARGLRVLGPAALAWRLVAGRRPFGRRCSMSSVSSPRGNPRRPRRVSEPPARTCGAATLVPFMRTRSAAPVPAASTPCKVGLSSPRASSDGPRLSGRRVGPPPGVARHLLFCPT